MFSQEAIRNDSACYYCWMCRHVCPIGNSTGREIHFPRGKGVLVSLTVHGNDVLKDSAKAMYDCFLCNNCAAVCETGYEPTKFIREARRELVVSDQLPMPIRKAVDAAMAPGGSLYGQKSISGDLANAVAGLPEKASVLLVLGDAIVMRHPEIGLAAISLMKKAGIGFTVLKNEPSPGADLYDLIGELADVQEKARIFADAVKQSGCKTVVALDPYTARILIQDYPRWDCDLGTAYTGTAFFAELLAEGKLTPQRKLEETVTYHDPDRLARDLEETEPPRQIISAIAAPWKEIFLNRKNTRCCGNDVVDSYSPDIVALTGRLRMDDALRTGAKLLVTASASDKDILSRVGEPAMVVEDILVLLDRCCGEEIKA